MYKHNIHLFFIPQDKNMQCYICSKSFVCSDVCSESVHHLLYIRIYQVHIHINKY